jgi:putative DNA primase/helicase
MQTAELLRSNLPSPDADGNPVPLAPDPDGLPPALRALPAWVVWRYERRGEHWTKVPYRPDGGGRATVTDPAHAADFPAAWAAYRQGGWDGIGLVLREADNVVAIDLDNCIADDGTLPSTVAALVERAGTFTERSPGGRGLHLFGRLADHAWGALPTGRRGVVDGVRVEIYRTARFIVVTGLRWADTPCDLADLRALVADLVAALDAPRQQPPPQRPQPLPSPRDNPAPTGGALRDDDVLALLSRYRRGDDFEALWRGQWQGRYQSQSEADLALANLLAWACGPDGRPQAERLWRQSGLAQRAKALR